MADPRNTPADPALASGNFHLLQRRRILEEVEAAKLGIPVSQYRAEREREREAAEQAEREARDAAEKALAQATVDAALTSLWLELEDLPLTILNLFPEGANGPQDLRPEHRHLRRFIESVARDR